ncbi:hypothetical protein CCHR01_05596 [Colletotrichum chrysophilum]|uniref:Uncharacterized protein n=1 Tax=Colletotrichum chrysophilum TaxID=1836956 RepID=A0AAD9EKG1_9PEZI|nr:hypothetical protein CCHR01_05596 [Colletotrichum chrysophilum]
MSRVQYSGGEIQGPGSGVDPNGPRCRTDAKTAETMGRLHVKAFAVSLVFGCGKPLHRHDGSSLSGNLSSRQRHVITQRQSQGDSRRRRSVKSLSAIGYSMSTRAPAVSISTAEGGRSPGAR